MRLYKIMVWFLSYIILSSVVLISECRFKIRTSSKCGSELKMLNCDMMKEDGSGEVLILSRLTTNEIRASYTPGDKCTIKASLFDWVLFDDSGKETHYANYSGRETYLLPPYSHDTGIHLISVYAYEYDDKGNFLDALLSGCAFEIQPEQPKLVISEGPERSVEANQLFEVSARETVDMNVPPGKRGHLTFRWSCETKSASTSFTDFCKLDNKLDEPSVFVPSLFVIPNTQFIFTVSVKSKDSDWVNGTQKINVVQGATIVKIVCLKNCFPLVPLTKAKSKTIVKAECLKGCQKLGTGTETHKWTVSEKTGSWTSGEQITGDTYVIKRNTLTPGSEYLLKCVPNVEKGAPAYLEIKTHNPGKLNSCSVDPKGGKAFKTEYTVTCDYTGSGYIWKIYSIKDNKETQLSRGTDLKYMKFILGPNAKIKVKMTDKYQYSDYKILDVEVDPLIPENSSPEEIAKKFDDMLFKTDSNQSISKLLDNKRFDDALTIINAAVDEVADHKHENIKKLEKKVLQAVKMIPSTTNERNKQKASLVNKIVTKYIDKPDPEIAKMGTEICASSAKENLKFLQKERYPHDFKTEILETASVLANCSQAASRKNEELLIPENITLPTTAHSLLEIPSITENYPDYVLDLNVTKNIKQLKQSVYNMIKICYTVSKTITTVMVTEEESETVDYNQFQVSAKKYSGTQNKIFSQDVDLLPSQDLLKYKSSDVDVMLCTSKTSPFWWNEKTICTDVAMIKFETKGHAISSFENPFEVTFRTNDEKENILKQFEAFPKRENMGHPRNREEEDFQKLTIYRVDVFKHTDYIVEFFNFTSTDSLDVFISYFEKPSFRIFQEKKATVSTTKKKFLIEHSENINAWFYLSLLKNKNTMSSEEYKFSIYHFSCYKWDYSSEDWIYSCKATLSSSLENITCLCYNSSVLIGHINNANVKLEETLMMELELKFQPSFIIFITLMVTFGLYCTLQSIFAVLGKVGRISVYFLGDIPSYYQYGYLIIVKTANRRNAGTTSNVMIKLHGSRSESDEHVLNYPDPDMNMLRRNQTDWFFLATEHYLGELTEITLWIDSIGQSPTWNCSGIEIIDLQKRKYWRLDINVWFSVKEEHLFFASSPTEKDKPSKVSVKNIKSLLNLLSQLEEPHLWNIFKEDIRLSKLNRLSIMYSICLTTYVFTLFFYGWPHLKYSDMLVQFTEYGFYPQIILGSFVSVIITGFIHVPIIWTLRMTHVVKRNDNKNPEKIKHYWNERKLFWNTVCWSILIFITISCTILLLIFGFWVPHTIGLLWLTSSIISLFIYIALIENVFRLVATVYFKHISREEEIFPQIDEIMEYVEAQREMLYKKFGPLLLRPYFQHLYKTPDDDFIKEKKFKANIKEQIFELVEDLLMILMYVVLLYIIVLYGRDQMDYQSNKETRELVSGIHARSFYFDDVKTMTEFHIYLTESLIYSTQSPYWYGTYLARNPGMTIDYSNKYIGVARLRQHRSDNSSCRIPEKMKFQNSSCISDFRTAPVYGNFSEEWGDDQQSDPKGTVKDSWKYTSAMQAGTLGHSGVLEYYPGGGYILPLGRTHRNSAIVFHYILQTKWLDRLTRVLFVEFLMYSSSSNLFNSVTVIFEYCPTGYLLRDLHVNTARLLLIKENTGLTLWIIYTVFMIMIITLTVKVVLKVIHKKKIYLKDLMHLLDIIIICLSITCVFLYADRARMVGQFLKELEASKHNQFVNYFHLYYSNWIFTILAALLVFLATLRLWNLLKFLLIIKIVEKTLVLCIKPILCVFLWQIIVLSSYGIAGVILFGDDFYSFRDISSSFLTLLMRSLGFDRSFNIESLESNLQFIYYISFMIINLLINTLYVAIITICYYDAQVIYSNTEQDTLIDFLKAKVYFYWKLMTIRVRNCRLRGGVNIEVKEEDDKFVFPKLDEHRFAQCLTSPKNKMETMVCVSLCVLRKMNRRTSGGLNTADKELMKDTIVGLFRDDSSDNDIFYISNLQGFEKALIDDDVFVKMEKVVKYLVTKEQESKANRSKELYEKLCRVQKSKINKMGDNLNLILRIVKQIEFDDMF